jgi:hypothetical protein
MERAGAGSMIVYIQVLDRGKNGAIIPGQEPVIKAIFAGYVQLFLIATLADGQDPHCPPSPGCPGGYCCPASGQHIAHSSVL